MKENKVSETQFYGPYLPLTDEQINQTYGPLNEFEHLVAQGTHQYRARVEQLIESGLGEEAKELIAYVEDRNSRLVSINSAHIGL